MAFPKSLHWSPPQYSGHTSMQEPMTGFHANLGLGIYDRLQGHRAGWPNDCTVGAFRFPEDIGVPHQQLIDSWIGPNKSSWCIFSHYRWIDAHESDCHELTTQHSFYILHHEQQQHSFTSTRKSSLILIDIYVRKNHQHASARRNKRELSRASTEFSIARGEIWQSEKFHELWIQKTQHRSTDQTKIYPSSIQYKLFQYEQRHEVACTQRR